MNYSDYIGFTFNGVHSSDLGIMRVSDGSRYNDSLLPTIQDKTVQAPGRDGTYFFGSYYTQRVFNISFVFDALTEEQLARIQALFGDKKIHDLIFDEMPYKAYQVKVTGSATIKYIPFGIGATNRIYKGEGSVQFTAYDPYARSVHKFLNEYEYLYLYYRIISLTDETYVTDRYYIKDNNGYSLSVEEYDSDKIYYERCMLTQQQIEEKQKEWNGAAKLQNAQGNYDKITNDNKIMLYNPGAKETDFILALNFEDDGKIPAGKIYISEDANKQLEFKEKICQGEDTQIRITTKLNLIEGYKNMGSAENPNWIKTGRIYNNCIKAGSFFKIPKSVEGQTLTLILDQVSSNFASIDYNYYYF